MIEKKHGKHWLSRFKKEVNAEFEIEKKVAALLDGIDFIKKKQEDMEGAGNELHRIMTPVANTTKYNVCIVGWGKRKEEYEWQTYYTLLVDYKAGFVQVLTDVTETN